MPILVMFLVLTLHLAQTKNLAVFIGFNHHREMVIFGAALLYNETTESFKWLFESFLKAHGGRKPKSIFTNQDFAIAKALAEVMSETWHGLCTWHIMQNGIKKLGNLMKDGSLFLRDFKDCMYKYDNESEFKEAWNKMIQTYTIKDLSWLNGIYKLKEKWANCYMKRVVTLGMRSTQLSESLNRDLKDYLKSDLNMDDFFEHFEMVVGQKWDKELEAKYNAREKLPHLCLKNSPLLKQASQVYAPTIFKVFQNEYDYAPVAIINNAIINFSDAIITRV